ATCWWMTRSAAATAPGVTGAPVAVRWQRSGPPAGTTSSRPTATSTRPFTPPHSGSKACGCSGTHSGLDGLLARLTRARYPDGQLRDQERGPRPAAQAARAGVLGTPHAGDAAAVEEITEDLLDRLATLDRPADLHEELSYPLPIMVICEPGQNRTPDGVRRAG